VGRRFVNWHLAGNSTTGPFSYRYFKHSVPPEPGVTFTHSFPGLPSVKVKFAGVTTPAVSFGSFSGLLPIPAPGPVYQPVQVINADTGELVLETELFADTGLALSFVVSVDGAGCPVPALLISECEDCPPLAGAARHAARSGVLPVRRTALRSKAGLPCHSVSYHLGTGLLTNRADV
jgi:hypothetical protein